LNFLDRFLKYTKISDFIKIRPVEAELLHADRKADRQTDKHDGGNKRFSQILGKSLKTQKFIDLSLNWQKMFKILERRNLFFKLNVYSAALGDCTTRVTPLAIPLPSLLRHCIHMHSSISQNSK
jgi:hypothetical protein